MSKRKRDVNNDEDDVDDEHTAVDGKKHKEDDQRLTLPQLPETTFADSNHQDEMVAHVPLLVSIPLKRPSRYSVCELSIRLKCDIEHLVGHSAREVEAPFVAAATDANRQVRVRDVMSSLKSVYCVPPQPIKITTTIYLPYHRCGCKLGVPCLFHARIHDQCFVSDCPNKPVHKATPAWEDDAFSCYSVCDSHQSLFVHSTCGRWMYFNPVNSCVYCLHCGERPPGVISDAMTNRQRYRIGIVSELRKLVELVLLKELAHMVVTYDDIDGTWSRFML